MAGRSRRPRTKEARELVAEVIAAGGTVESNAQGHLVVTGPLGRAVTGSEFRSPGSHDVARATIAKYAGIIIPRRGCGGGRKAGLGMIIYRKGDLFAWSLPAIAHGVNCRGVMGAGIAAQFKARYPRMYASYRRRCLRGAMFPGEILPWQHDDGTLIFNLATQYEPGPDAKPWMITAAVGQMITEAVTDFRITEIGLPMIGCGIGGLTQDQLRAALHPYMDAPVNLIVFEYTPAQEVPA